jgi:HEAT repeat protein
MVRALTNETVFNALRETYDAGLLRALMEVAPDHERALRLVTLIHRKPPEWKGEWWAYHPFQLSPPAKSVEWEGTKAADDFILAGLGNSSSRARLAAINGVAETKDPRAVPFLSNLMTNVSDLAAVLIALKRIGGTHAHETVLHYLQQPFGTPSQLKQALEFLETYPAAKDGNILMRFVEHPEDSIRAPAFNALAKAAPERIIPCSYLHWCALERGAGLGESQGPDGVGSVAAKFD